MPDEEKWYFAKGGTSHGPLSLHALVSQFSSGAFTESDYVYCKGKTDGWVKASSIPGLCESLTPEPEPEPEHHQVPLYERASFTQATGEDRKKAKGKFWAKLTGKK